MKHNKPPLKGDHHVNFDKHSVTLPPLTHIMTLL